jgi:Carbohydrate-selective porin, OprB family/S-layer homology domain
MNRKNLNLLVFSLAIFLGTIEIAKAESLTQLRQNKAEQLGGAISYNDSLGQVTNVSQLKDVTPTDWAYEALQSLAERYGCIAGYPNSSFKGNKPLNRYEFAAGLNSCMQQIERLIASNESILREDLAKLQRLSEEFQAELATLGKKIDNLEGRTAFLEDHQFSTTTILNGEVIFGLAFAGGGNPPGGCQFTPQGNEFGEDIVDCRDRRDPETNVVLSNLTRLGLQTSFSGKDRLRTYLTTGNFGNGGFTNPESLNTYMARLSYQADLDNKVILDLLEYRFPILDDKVIISVIPFGFSLSNVLSANSPYFDTGRGSISRFGEESPIFKLGGVLDAGVGLDWLIANPVRLQIAYGTSDSSNPNGGFFGADRSVVAAQLLLKPTENIVTGLTYVNLYTSDGVLGTYTGSVNAETTGLWSNGRLPVVNPDGTIGGIASPGLGKELDDFPAKTDAVGGSFQWRMTDKLTLAAWGGWTSTNFLNGLSDFPQFSPSIDAGEDVLNTNNRKPFGNAATYLFSLALSDPFGREGDLLAFLFGMPPKLVDAGPVTEGQSVPFSEISRRGENGITITDNDPRLDPRVRLPGVDSPDSVPPEGLDQFGRKDEATSLHFEVFYRFKVNDNISITPGIFVVTNPGHIEDNDALYVGTIRTTFRF